MNRIGGGHIKLLQKKQCDSDSIRNFYILPARATDRYILRTLNLCYCILARIATRTARCKLFLRMPLHFVVCLCFYWLVVTTVNHAKRMNRSIFYAVWRRQTIA